MNQEYTVDPSRLVSPDMTPADTEEVSLRPKTLDDYVGQEKAKGNLKVYLRAAQQRGEPMDHILLYGPPGLGKTTLAGIVAQEMGVQIRITSGPAIEKPGDLAALLTNLQEGDILFIDEIHRLSRQVEEVLYPALEDFALDIMIGKGPSAQSIRINLPRFTLVGATTRAGQLTGPLRDRFGILLKLEPYSPRELGLGKTTLAGIVAQEMGVQIRITSGPAIEKPGDLAALLTNLQEGDILFIDEIHRLSRQVEEVLYPALEDFALDIMIGKGPSAQSIRINLPRFTLVGATTRAGQLTGPLRDRFGILLKLEPYSPRELGRIILRSAGILGVPITEEGALELARCARGTPRIANRMLKRVRDFATVQGDGTIDEETAIAARKWMDIDELGLDELDRSVLRAIIEMYGGGPVGLETLAAALGEESVTLEDICEPYLMQMGMLTRTPRGRCVTRLAYEHLHMAVPKRFDDEDSGQTSMF